MILSPDNFINILENAVRERRPAEYQTHSGGRVLYIDLETADMALKLFSWFDEYNYREFLRYVPHRITELLVKLWEISSRLQDYRSLFGPRTHADQDGSSQLELFLV